MKEHGVDACIVPTSDYHDSEYVSGYFKCREYLSGFTGSAGTLVVLADEAGLWTDGRYFLQAASQLEGTGIELKKAGEPGVPTIEQYLVGKMRPGQTLACDGRCITMERAWKLEESLRSKNILIKMNMDLAGEVWKDRPLISASPVWELPLEYAGVSREEKIQAVREKLQEKGADYLLLSSLPDICWLLNVRGGDVACTPVVLSYLLIGRQEVLWYVQDVVSDEILSNMEGIRTKDYHGIYQDLPDLLRGKTVWYDSRRLNAALGSLIPDSTAKIDEAVPTQMAKAIKNEKEQENFRIAHQKDGVAVTKFIFWLKGNVSGETITELSAAKYLENLRAEHEHYLGPSFDPIIAYSDHGAIIHYSADETTNRTIYPGGFLLADTGGHYLEGTTDITRTISTGALTKQEKEMYTRVLQGHIRLAMKHFTHGETGASFDAAARQPLLDIGYDYNHGTGHGVGYLLSVHEGPNMFRKKKAEDTTSDCVIEEGMITSNEPGVYLEGKFGVRIEDLVLCVKDPDKKDGLMLETLTLVPFDRAAILPELLTKEEKEWLNAYHETVYEKISPYLSLAEKTWLRKETEAL